MSQEKNAIIQKYRPIIARRLAAGFRSKTKRRSGKSVTFRSGVKREFGDISQLVYATSRAAFVLNNSLPAGKTIKAKVPGGRFRTYTRKKSFTRTKGFIAEAIAQPVEQMADELGEHYADIAANVPALQ